MPKHPPVARIVDDLTTLHSETVRASLTRCAEGISAELVAQEKLGAAGLQPATVVSMFLAGLVKPMSEFATGLAGNALDVVVRELDLPSLMRLKANTAVRETKATMQAHVETLRVEPGETL